MIELTAPPPASIDWMWWVCQGTRTNRAGLSEACTAKLLRRSVDFCGHFEIVCPHCKTKNLIQR